MNKKKGISLIVLVITILVMIILAGVVIVSLQKDNPVEKAKEAKALSSISAVREAVTQYAVTKQAGVESKLTLDGWGKVRNDQNNADVNFLVDSNKSSYTAKLNLDAKAGISKLLGVDIDSIKDYGTLYVNPETGSTVFELVSGSTFTAGNGIVKNGEVK